ncbi:hypothetical protein J2Z53_000232 [Clostridium moniliforme]|uniref:Uncharacterized protein n=1 Tax=Clostridium moniliforme TaxID=39489 RepID=A0ABS4EXD2_9CLOT|nr:hypothetical protein [Clostridium moniliforme]MBP1888653.1 hypothetical protein [Clostridium moniliforme]
MKLLLYLIIGLPLIFVIILMTRNIIRIKKSRDETLNKKNKK